MNGTDVDDLAWALCLQPVPNERLSDKEHALQVDAQDEVEIFFADFPEIGATLESRVVDENIDRSHLGDSFQDDFSSLIDPADVALNGHAFSAKLLDLLYRFVCALFVFAKSDRNIGAFLRESN